MFDEKSVDEVGRVLADESQPLKARFRALFTLKGMGGEAAVRWLASALRDPSALLGHEAAFCLGQTGHAAAKAPLEELLRDRDARPIVRHEAGEALGAIGTPDVLDVLREFSSDPVVEVAETCQLAVRRVEWLQRTRAAGGAEEERLGTSTYDTVDPVPAAASSDVKQLRCTLLDDGAPLYERYRAMFALRNVGSNEAVLALSDGLSCGSALFRHEVAFVLGQMQHPASVPALASRLAVAEESGMVRHECAEALGSVATPESLEILRAYRDDPERVVRESVEVALDMWEHEAAGEFQYANTHSQLSAAAVTAAGKTDGPSAAEELPNGISAH
ncbi:deoxyhypusine hydroxylase [Petromyzon marinus]|uniref:deoxyhypusine hydroxylase n=1 Tax=Petromyzon marinus TaxID=7757 RepID=UPI003F71D225